MNWRRINYALHRDIGFLCIGLSIIYAISGVAVNHIDDWNPSYTITTEISNIGRVDHAEMMVSREEIDSILKRVGATEAYRDFHQDSENTVNIFLEGNRIRVNLDTGRVEQTINKTRPILYESNFLHLNHPKQLWTYVADLYAVGLLLLAVTGLLMLFKSRGIKRREAVLTMIGFAVPAGFLVLYL